ncbi:MAG: hypothetical protein SGPRY_009911, partial [Prymnesium sp.]
EELSKERQDQEMRDLEAAAAALRDAPPPSSEREEWKKADEPVHFDITAALQASRGGPLKGI